MAEAGGSLQAKGLVRRHIGIVAVSHVGAAIFYRELSELLSEALPAPLMPRLTVHNEPVHEYIEAVESQDWSRVAGLLSRSARILAQAGADVCMTPDNAVQFALQLAEDDSPIPWLALTDTATEAIASDGRRVVGLVGTKWVTQGATYQASLGMRGIQALAPEDDEAAGLHAMILGELIYGRITPGSRRTVETLLRHFSERGADSVLLCCSEAPLLVERGSSPLPVYDSVGLLARRAVRWACEPASGGEGPGTSAG